VCGQAKAEPVTLAFTKAPKGGSKILHAPYFVDYVVRQLSDKYGPDFIYRGDMKVFTTLNWTMQSEAERDLDEGIASANDRGATQGALVSMDPNTGYIKAMVGGVDYAKSQFNIAADARRQPGSSFKPIIYTAALDSGLITENTQILDEPVSFPSGTGTRWAPKDDDGRFRGWVTAKHAIALSINVAAVKVLREVGVQTAVRYARMLGVKSPLAPYLTLALGASAVTPLEMADVYSVFANQGQRPIVTAVERITDNDGNVIEDDPPQLETVPINKDAITQMSDMLRAVVTEGTASGAFRDGNPPDMHGKTGTTQSHLDVWFDGYTSKLVCVCWAGHPTTDPKTHRALYGIPMTHEAFGATICAPIVKRFMVSALAEMAKDAALQAPPKPKITPALSVENASNSDRNATSNQNSNGAQNSNSNSNSNSAQTTTLKTEKGTVTVWVDDATGLRAHPGSSSAHQETFARGSEPTVYAPGQASPAAAPQPAPPPEQRIITVTICAESGLRATQWCPETVQQQFVAGTEPRKYCNIHGPPPGEH
jgi:membrane peptidoglycan carboxypeptidase